MRQVLYTHVLLQDAQAESQRGEAALLLQMRAGAHDALPPQASPESAQRREAPRVPDVREEVLREVCSYIQLAIANQEG